MRVDLHLHSRYSQDAKSTLEGLIARCRATGLDRIALTDHNTADGALKLREMAPELAIVGEEIRTTEGGEIIGLWISKTITPWRSAEAVMDEVHGMGGLVYIPHPFDPWRPHFEPEQLTRLANRIDIIETYNAWCNTTANQAAEKFAESFGKPAAWGSDAHASDELGHSWQEVEPFSGARDFLDKLSRSSYHRTEVSGSHRRRY